MKCLINTNLKDERAKDNYFSSFFVFLLQKHERKFYLCPILLE